MAIPTTAPTAVPAIAPADSPDDDTAVGPEVLALLLALLMSATVELGLETEAPLLVTAADENAEPLFVAAAVRNEVVDAVRVIETLEPLLLEVAQDAVAGTVTPAERQVCHISVSCDDYQHAENDYLGQESACRRLVCC